nr:MAG: ORF3 [Torque teno polar bear virus 4]
MGRRLRFGDRRGERCATSAIAPETPPKATAPTLEAGATAAEKARQISRRREQNEKLQALIDELYGMGRGNES